MYRHGDVILMKVETIPADATRRPTSILARGEATGHSHRIADGSSASVFDHAGVGYLDVKADRATLVHAEHAAIELPRGVYRFWQQREYPPKEIRRIGD